MSASIPFLFSKMDHESVPFSTVPWKTNARNIIQCTLYALCVTHSGVYISGAIVLGIYVNEVKAPRLGPVSIGKTEIS